MISYLPVGDAVNLMKGDTKAVDLSLSRGLAIKILDSDDQYPKNIKDLTSENIFTSILSVDAAAELKIPFGDASGKFSRRIFIMEYLKYVDMEKEGGKVRYGVGIRAVSNFKLLSGKAKTSSLPFIAASAELGFIEATLSFDVLGLQSQKITDAIPSPSRLDVETYTLIGKAFDKIKKLVWDNDTIVSPRILSVMGSSHFEDESLYDESVAVCWALTRIKNREKLGDALKDIQDESEQFIETVRRVYSNIANITENDGKPDNRESRNADQILMGLEMK
jgi:hypothetical protein